MVILNESLFNTYKDASKVMGHAVYHKTPVKTLARSAATIGGALSGRWVGRQLVSKRDGESDEDFKARRKRAGNIGLLAGAAAGYSRRRYKEGKASVDAANAKLNLDRTGKNEVKNAIYGMANNRVASGIPL